MRIWSGLFFASRRLSLVMAGRCLSPCLWPVEGCSFRTYTEERGEGNGQGRWFRMRLARQVLQAGLRQELRGSLRGDLVGLCGVVLCSSPQP